MIIAVHIENAYLYDSFTFNSVVFKGKPIETLIKDYG